MPLTTGGKNSPLANSVLRIDDFTPASLVSHSANRKSTELSKTDRLPKMRDKCVITKEMAPLFTGHEDELMKKFAVLASVLDGEGYISSSGNHGQRGYEEALMSFLDCAFRYLEQIVFGSAILENRQDITITDLHLALGIALGSATPRYRKIARIFFEADTARTVQDLVPDGTG